MKSITNRLQLWHLIPVALIALLAVAVFVWVERGQFAQNKVALSIEGSAQMEGGGREEFTVRLENNSGISLVDAHVSVSLPKELRTTEGEDSVSLNVESIEPGGVYTEEIDLTSTSATAHVVIEARADYSPEGVNARFITRTAFELTIGSLDADVSLLLPETAYADEEIEGTILVRPNTSFAQTILYARLDVPPGFEVTRVEPEFSNEKDRTWKLGALRQAQETEVKFWGIWNGAEELSVAASIGKYEGIRFLPLHIEEASVAVSPLPITTQIRLAQDQPFSYASDTVSFELIVANQGDEALRDVVVSLAGAQSFTSLSPTEAGEGETSLEWTSADVADLAQMDSGSEVVIPFFAFVDVPEDVQISSLSIETSTRADLSGGQEFSDTGSYELLIRNNDNEE